MIFNNFPDVNITIINLLTFKWSLSWLTTKFYKWRMLLLNRDCYLQYLLSEYHSSTNSCCEHQIIHINQHRYGWICFEGSLEVHHNGGTRPCHVLPHHWFENDIYCIFKFPKGSMTVDELCSTDHPSRTYRKVRPTAILKTQRDLLDTLSNLIVNQDQTWNGLHQFVIWLPSILSDTSFEILNSPVVYILNWMITIVCSAYSHRPSLLHVFWEVLLQFQIFHHVLDEVG